MFALWCLFWAFWMGLFQDEPEEPSKFNVSTSSNPRLFGAEPEETSRPHKQARSSSSASMPVTLFGDEPKEKQLHQTRGPQAQACHEHDDDDDEGQVQQATLNLDWSAMKLFSSTTFLEKMKNESKPEQKKRTYDNSKRAERSASTLKHISTSFKDSALKPDRLQSLVAKPQCKCFFGQGKIVFVCILLIPLVPAHVWGLFGIILIRNKNHMHACEFPSAQVHWRIATDNLT